MRRTIWILAVGFILTIGVSSARADTYTATFTCSGTCTDFPNPVDVTFPSPSILEMWDGVTDFVTLVAGDNPGDSYTWSNSLEAGTEGPEVEDYSLFITDVTTGDVEGTFGTVGTGDLFFTSFTDNGTLTFSSSGGSNGGGDGGGNGGGNGNTPAPEPSSIGFLLSGIGTLLATRKFRA